MGSLEDRIRKLEAAAGRRQEDAADIRRGRLMDRFYHEQENARRELEGREPEPLPPELEETREEVLETLSNTIPWYRERGSWGQDGTEANEFLRAWENECLEKLSELDREGKE